MTNLARTLYRPFSEILPRGDQGEMLKKVGRYRGFKNTLAKWHQLLISMHLKCKHRATFCCKLRLHKCYAVMTNLARTPKSAIFWDFAKGGPRENAQKSRPTIGASAKFHLLISMLLKCKHRATFCCKLQLHKCPYSRVMTNLAKTPKSAIFWDFAKGGPRENAQKSRPTIGASKTPSRNWHHLLISMHLKCKHRATFCCKLRLHKCCIAELCVICHLNRPFSEILPRGDQGKMLKKVGRL